MNLQIVSPYAPCPYNCPYCVSNFEGDYQFSDLYHENKEAYLNRLRGILIVSEEEGDFTGAIITGLTDPTLFPEWIDDVKNVLKDFTLEEITLQTSNYNYQNTSGLTVIAYSIGHRDKIHLLPTRNEIDENVILRFNIMLSKDLDFTDALRISAHSPQSQYTVKYLALTSHGHSETDEWVVQNRIELSKKEEDTLKKLGYWIDKTCMEAKYRYRVFREDGSLYDDWIQRKEKQLPILAATG